MRREIIVNSSLVETRVAILEDNVLVEVLLDSSKNEGIAGSIYKGRVSKVLPGMQAAFVDIGLTKDAFLYVRDIYEDLEEYERLLGIEEEETMEEIRPRSRPSRRGTQPIEDLIQEGQDVLVQVAREPIGSKGARITSRITLPGRYLVYMPTEQQMGVSRKIENEGERVRLRRIAEEINIFNEGLIIRTAGVGKGKEELQSDLEFLRSLWKKIKAKAEFISAPGLIHRDLDLVFRIFRDLFTKDVTRLVVDFPGEYERCLEYLESICPELKPYLYLYTEDEPIFKSFGIERELEKALKPKMWLPSGGYIVIEETEALVSIDVNTGKYIGKQDFEETVLKTNLEAAREIARQMRLRNLGGIIIIDFIDMARADHRERVFSELKEALKADRSPTNVLFLSELGLVEMTRKRAKEGLSKIWTHPCPACGGLGWIRSTPFIAHQILREVEWRLLKKRLKRIRIKAHPDIIGWLKAEEAEIIGVLQENYKKEVVLISDDTLASGKYQLLEG